jgi:hypothetical protein
MPSSIEANIGVSVKLQLNFKNLHTIVKLLSSDAQLIIYGLKKPIDRDCKFNDDEYKSPYFDNRILQNLYKLKNEEEFIEYASKIAEIRDDKKILRKKIDYINFEDEEEVNDYLEFFENYDNCENDVEDDTEDESDEKIITNYKKNNDKKKIRTKYEHSKVEQKYVNCDLNKTKISYLFYVNLLNFDVNLSLKKEYDTDFGSVANLTEFINNIEKAKKFFTDFGIDKESLSFFNYNTSEGY